MPTSARRALVVPQKCPLLTGSTWAAIALVLGGTAVFAGVRAERTVGCEWPSTGA
jgi:hypothetical protein